MELNKETAMRIWNISFGKETKAYDFAGRQIDKEAYNDRNSDYGWNVNYILPENKGGVTVDYNLICCHIKTNDEKADKFPLFKANEKTFKLTKVQNHFKILPEDEQSYNIKAAVNFYDSTASLKFFNDLKENQNKHCFIGSVLIRIKNLTNTAIIDFIDKIFEEENITYSMHENYRGSETRIIIKNYNIPTKEDRVRLLDKCTVLHTYFNCYFADKGYFDSYEIYYRNDEFEKKEMYLKANSINFDDIYGDYYNTFFINDSVIKNTDVRTKSSGNEYTKHDSIFTALALNLLNEGEKHPKFHFPPIEEGWD